ncbi:MAG: flagellar hook capping FlgD N-terminal domain-containing protein, partial [Pseudomonadota bacterium]|nr:flagellar hook capping FlgD N-terminal domain-containing protein [Pseudomonadota bacterium]
MVDILNNPAVSNAASSANAGVLGQTQGRGMDSLGQGEFLKLLTVQMQQQDPFE